MSVSSASSDNRLDLLLVVDVSLVVLKNKASASCIPVLPLKAATLLSAVGQLPYLFDCVGSEHGRRERAVSLDSQ